VLLRMPLHSMPKATIHFRRAQFRKASLTAFIQSLLRCKVQVSARGTPRPSTRAGGQALWNLVTRTAARLPALRCTKV
jgi:hypothetical protein